jgi:hypothetical protein
VMCWRPVPKPQALRGTTVGSPDSLEISRVTNRESFGESNPCCRRTSRTPGQLILPAKRTDTNRPPSAIQTRARGAWDRLDLAAASATGSVLHGYAVAPTLRRSTRRGTDMLANRRLGTETLIISANVPPVAISVAGAFATLKWEGLSACSTVGYPVRLVNHLPDRVVHRVWTRPSTAVPGTLDRSYPARHAGRTGIDRSAY